MPSQASSGANNAKPVLLFASLPKRVDLYGVTVYVSRPPASSHYAKTAYQWLVLKCRMLIFAEIQILSSPVLRSDSHLYVVMSKTFLAAGKLKELLDRHGLHESGCRPVEVSDSVMQAVLNYSLLARMAPRWNQLGPSYLVQGRDFLMDTSPMSAVKLNILVQGDQVSLSVCPLRLRLPHLQLSDLEVGSEVTAQFLSQQLPALSASNIGCEWLCTLPGLRRGRVVSVTHKIPPTCPFLTYRELRRHWKNMYGYRLPEERPDSTCSPAGPYITISFRKQYNRSDVGYTYPGLCVRALGPTFLHNVDQAAVVRDFASDLTSRLTQLCGLSFQLSLRLGHPLSCLNPAQSSQTSEGRTLQQQQQLPANFAAVPVSSLPSGWKASSSVTASQQSRQFSQSSQLHTQSWQQARTVAPAPQHCTSGGRLPYQHPSTQTSQPPQLVAPHASLEGIIKSESSKSSHISIQTKSNENIHLISKEIELNQTTGRPIFTPNSYDFKAPVGTMRMKPLSAVVSLNTPMWYGNSKFPSLAADAEDLSAQPMQSAAGQHSSAFSGAVPPITSAGFSQHSSASVAAAAVQRSSSSKWDPKPVRAPVQEPAVTSSVADRKLYVPVFGKKTKPGEHVKSGGKVTANPPATAPTPKVSKPFKNPQAYTSISNIDDLSTPQLTPSSVMKNQFASLPAAYNTDEPPAAVSAVMKTTPTYKMQVVSKSTLTTGTFSMSINPRPVFVAKPPQAKSPFDRGGKSLGMAAGKCKSVSQASEEAATTPSKKARASKPEPSAEEIERLAREGRLDQVSAPLLVKWLRDRSVLCKARDKKAELVTKVAQLLNL